MNIFNFDPLAVLSFLLTFMRVSIVLFMLPIFDVQGLPGLWKAAVCMVLTFAIWPVIQLSGYSMPAHPFDIALLIFGEVVLGLILAISIRFFFAGIQSGAEMLAMQMGFSMMQFADPLSGNQTGLIAQMLYTVTILIFLTLDGHLFLISGFIETFAYIPAGGLLITEALFDQIINLSNIVFILAVKIIAPVMVAIFLVELSLGLMNRVAPQMQIMEIGFPVKIAVGFFFLSLIFGLISLEIEQFIIGLNGLFVNILKAGGAM